MHADEWNLSYFEFRSLHKFTNKLMFLWHLLDLKLQKAGRKLKQSLGVPILTRELYVFTRRDLCLSTASSFWNVYLALHCKVRIYLSCTAYVKSWLMNCKQDHSPWIIFFFCIFLGGGANWCPWAVQKSCFDFRKAFFVKHN